MKMISALVALLLVTARHPVNYQFADPDDQKTDLALTHKESFPGISVNLNGYRE